MRIRPFHELDSHEIEALWRTVFPVEPPHNEPTQAIQRKLAVQPDLFFVAEVNSAIVGSIMAGYDGHRGWLYAVAVSPEYRRQGIGAALIRHVEAVLLALGCPKINLQVRSSNAGVVIFYQKLGYEVEDRISLGKVLV